MSNRRVKDIGYDDADDAADYDGDIAGQEDGLLGRLEISTRAVLIVLRTESRTKRSGQNVGREFRD
jgi:hypothetical protein